MLLDQLAVSRKTPKDGMLEISAEAAARLAVLGADFALATEGGEGRGRLKALACSCAKVAGAGHVHHFVESPLLMALAPGSEVRVELDDENRAVRVDPAAP
jgi:hypothetical protein